MQKFCFALTKIKANQTLVTTDAMVHMHHRVTDLQLGQIAHHRINLRNGFLPFTTGASPATGIQLSLGNDGQVTQRRLQ